MEKHGRRKVIKGFNPHFLFYKALLLLHLSSNVTCNMDLATALNLGGVAKFFEPDSEAFRNIPINPVMWHVKEMLQVLKLWGLTGEEHKVVTKDGYILSLFRISPRRNTSTPVLFCHGAAVSPETWTLRGKDDLAITLYNEGYDVWLASYRGSNYGRKHLSLSPDDDKFWDFSFHEHALYDIPVMIDHILSVTAFQRVVGVGHSMGNAVFMAMLALRPEYNDKVALFVGLAPYAVVRMENNLVTSRLMPRFISLLKLPFVRPLFDRRKIAPLVTLCTLRPALCMSIIDMTQGLDIKNVDRTALSVIVAYMPSGTSVKVLQHLYDLRNGQFRQFDYGTEGNLARYNQSVPPAYNLTNFRVPVSLYFGSKDRRVSLRGMDAQVKALPNVVGVHVIPGFGHADFLLGRKTPELLNRPVLEDLRKYAALS